MFFGKTQGWSPMTEAAIQHELVNNHIIYWIKQNKYTETKLMVSDGCVFQPMVVDLLLNPRHIRHSRLSSRCPLCKRNSERNPPSMTSTIDYWFMWRCTFFKIWTVSNASACATKSPCWSSLPHPRRCALVGSWWSCMALSWTTSSTPGCMSNGWLWIQSFALAIAFQCRPVSSRWFSTFQKSGWRVFYLLNGMCLSQPSSLYQRCFLFPLLKGPGFPTVFLENFPMFEGFLKAKCFPTVKVRAQGCQKKKK